MVQFHQTTPDGALGTTQQVSNVADAAVSQFEGLDGGITSAVVCGQGSEEGLHRAFDVLTVSGVYSARPGLAQLVGGRARRSTSDGERPGDSIASPSCAPSPSQQKTGRHWPTTVTITPTLGSSGRWRCSGSRATASATTTSPPTPMSPVAASNATWTSPSRGACPACVAAQAIIPEAPWSNTRPPWGRTSRRTHPALPSRPGRSSSGGPASAGASARSATSSRTG